MEFVIGGNRYLKVKSVRIARVSQKLLRLLNIRSRSVCVVKVGIEILKRRQHRRAYYGSVAAAHEIVDRILVKSIADRLSYSHIVKRLLKIVEEKSLNDVGGRSHHIKAVFKLVCLRIGKISINIYRTALKLKQRGLRTVDDLEIDLFKIRKPLLPVIVKLLYLDSLLRRVGNKRKRSRSDGIRLLVLPATRGNDRGYKAVNQLRIGVLHLDTNRLFINNINGLNRAKSGNERGPVQQSRNSLKRVLHILSRHGAAIVKLHVFPENEGVFQPVLRNGIITGNGAYQIAVFVRLYQAFKNIKQDFLSSCRCRFVRVKTVNILLYTYNNGAFLLLRGIIARRRSRAACASAQYSRQKCHKK